MAHLTVYIDLLSVHKGHLVVRNSHLSLHGGFLILVDGSTLLECSSKVPLSVIHFKDCDFVSFLFTLWKYKTRKVLKFTTLYFLLRFHFENLII